jgi:hypothetical protein
MTASIIAQISARGTGLDLTINSLPQGSAFAASDIWTMGGWTLQFINLGAGQRLPLDQSNGNIYVKVILGALANLKQDRFAQRKQARDTRVTEEEAIGGAEGCLMAILTETSAVAANIHTMDELTVSGPLSDVLKWLQFDKSYIGKQLPYFNGLDTHLLPGFHLLDAQGDEIIYVHFWTAGKGVDMSPHNHSPAPTADAPAFTETHWVLNNGTGRGAMYDCNGSRDPADRSYITMLRGQDHGPYWTVEPDTGMPKLKENGAIEFGFHGWQAGTDDDPQQAYDLVAAFELSHAHSKI